MLPLCLRLKNFLSYREPPPLDLRGMQVVCLSGNNGQGKSALLDAITWALWGCARGYERPDLDSLVHHGQQEMWVEVEFALGGRVYKVHRQYQRAGPRRNSQSRLALQVQVSADPIQWRDISGNSLRETEQEIITLLGMDYKTFVHTAYLLQGEADRFMKVGPQDRRRLLARILGLDIYENALQTARERKRIMEERLCSRKEELSHLQQEVARRPELEATLARIQADLSQVDSRWDACRRQVDDLRLQEHTLLTLQRQRETLLAQAEGWDREAQDLLRQAQEVEHQIQEAQGILLRREDIQQGLERYQQVSQRLEGMEQVRQEHDRLTQAIAQDEKAIAEEKARLETDLLHLRERLQENQRLAEGVSRLEEALQRLTQQEEVLAQQERDAQAKQAQVDAWREEASTYEARAQHARQEMQTLRQRLDMLQAQAQPICPLCRTPLGPAGKAHLEAEITAQGKALRQEHDAAQRAAQEVRQKAQALAQEIANALRRLEQGRRDLATQRARLTHELEVARAAVQQVSQLGQEVQALQERLALGSFAQKERERLAQSRKALAALGYDPSSHQALRLEMNRLQPYLQKAERLAQAERDLPRLHKALDSLRYTARQRQQDAQRAREEARRAEEALQRLPPLQAALQNAQRELDNFQRERDRLQQEVGILRQTLQGIQEKEQRLQALQEEAVALQRDQEAYAVLERAFSPQGIPTRIIESVVHDLSDIATDILRRLTNGQMALRIETTRQTKAGSPTEALDVRIDDGYGERSYEMFSGGERFRIDFALRLALGKLLAQRSGHPIRTLFVDEGFGSQDAVGRTRLVEAIQAVRTDFDLIVVITHMDDLKEYFPIRIEVNKTPQGSLYTVEVA